MKDIQSSLFTKPSEIYALHQASTAARRAMFQSLSKNTPKSVSKNLVEDNCINM